MVDDARSKARQGLGRSESIDFDWPKYSLVLKKDDSNQYYLEAGVRQEYDIETCYGNDGGMTYGGVETRSATLQLTDSVDVSDIDETELVNKIYCDEWIVS